MVLFMTIEELEKSLLNACKKPETTFKNVEKIITAMKKHFNLEYEKAGKGSHYVIRHDILKDETMLSDFKLGYIRDVNQYGELTVSTVSGRYVKLVYLKNLQKVYNLLKQAKTEGLL